MEIKTIMKRSHFTSKLPEVSPEVGIRYEVDENISQSYLHYLESLFEETGLNFQKDIESPYLLVRNPNWPVEGILFIVRGSLQDLGLLDWMIQFACRSKAEVTVLVVHPDIPNLYNVNPNVQLELPMLLQLDNECGQVLRAILHQMEFYHIHGELRLVKGVPDEQIRSQMEVQNYDLVLISRESRGRFERLWLGEILTPMLRWIDRPVFVV
jgi:nucleotide-binding universal stress UspA family protein